MMSKNLVLILLFGSLTFSCSKNSTEEEKENLPTPTIIDTGIADTTVTYTNYTKKIIDDNCISCHSASGLNVSPHLITYSEVKTITDAGRLKARVIDELPTKMPPSGSLPQSTKDTLQLWINQGATE